MRGPALGDRLVGLSFAGHEDGSSTSPVLDLLAKLNLHATFFLSNRFLVMQEHQLLLHRMVAEGHSLNPYLVDLPGQFALGQEHIRQVELLRSRLHQLRGPSNRDRQLCLAGDWQGRNTWADWLAEYGLVLIGPTPGMPVGSDYPPENTEGYCSGAEIVEQILQRETETRDGLVGFIVTFHLGAHPERLDRFHAYLPQLLDELSDRKYCLVSIERLLDDLLSDHEK